MAQLKRFLSNISFPGHWYRRIKLVKDHSHQVALSETPKSSSMSSSHTQQDQEELCAECWREACVTDAWHIQTHAMIHICGPSCWKYNANGVRICRHHCYHITMLDPDPESPARAEKPLKLRRDGRPLNNQLYIIEEAARGKRGRIAPIVVHPNETMTNYGAANSLRCNFDCQSMLYLPPHSVLALDEVPNIGQQPQYQHMERNTGDLHPKWLLTPLGKEGSQLLPSSKKPTDGDNDKEILRMCENVYKEIEAECLQAFQDAHNTGFYVNEYTTKVHALGDKLFEGLRRASQKVLDKEAASNDEETNAKIKDKARIKNILMKMVNLMNSMQIKSGSELVFPMLYDHLSFSTHRTWEMNMKRPWAKALASWEKTYKYVLKELHQHGDQTQGFFLPTTHRITDPTLKDLVALLPRGWLVQERTDTPTQNMTCIARAVEAETGQSHQYVFVSPGSQVFTNIKTALQHASKTKDLYRLGNDPQTKDMAEKFNSEGTQRHEVARYTFEFTSNHDDYMCRGLDGLLAPLPAYVYNMWVYTTRKMTENDPRAWHHIDIPFDDSYKIAAVKVQRLSIQPRIPQIQGLNIPAPGVDPNKSALLKLLLC